MAAEHGGRRETEGPEPGVAYPSLPRQLPTQPPPSCSGLASSGLFLSPALRASLLGPLRAAPLLASSHGARIPLEDVARCRVQATRCPPEDPRQGWPTRRSRRFAMGARRRGRELRASEQCFARLVQRPAQCLQALAERYPFARRRSEESTVTLRPVWRTTCNRARDRRQSLSSDHTPPPVDAVLAAPRTLQAGWRGPHPSAQPSGGQFLGPGTCTATRSALWTAMGSTSGVCSSRRPSCEDLKRSFSAIGLGLQDHHPRRLAMHPPT